MSAIVQEDPSGRALLPGTTTQPAVAINGQTSPNGTRKDFTNWEDRALKIAPTSQRVFQSPALTRNAFYADERTLIFHADVSTAFRWLAAAGLKVDCMVTSPPFYGQRDYEVPGQLGLEDNPLDYINKLVTSFNHAKDVLKETGSLWVNLGDTYWSGRGEHKGKDDKQSARRFGIRPQDKKGDGKYTRGKQLLLIPHRFAIAMQESSWVVRNDNVWVKPNPLPDQVLDRGSMSHEYVFHFVRQRFYYYNRNAVGRPTSNGTFMPPLDTWQVPISKGHDSHKATFSEELVRIPVLATTPPDGVVLDPFAGSGTTLLFAQNHGFRAIGIDIKEEYCRAMEKSVRDQWELLRLHKPGTQS
jgi:site-specific DNA-methyltransferase (adenine-specific)